MSTQEVIKQEQIIWVYLKQNNILNTTLVTTEMNER